MKVFSRIFEPSLALCTDPLVSFYCVVPKDTGTFETAYENTLLPSSEALEWLTQCCLSNHRRNLMTQRAGEMAQMENCLLSKHEDLGLDALYPQKSRHGRVRVSVHKCWRRWRGGTVTEPAKTQLSAKYLESKTKPMVQNCMVLHNFCVSGFWRWFPGWTWCEVLYKWDFG